MKYMSLGIVMVTNATAHCTQDKRYTIHPNLIQSAHHIPSNTERPYDYVHITQKNADKNETTGCLSAPAPYSDIDSKAA